MFGYAATSSSITQPTDLPFDYNARVPFFRLSYTDDVIAGGLWEFIRTTGWERVAIMHVRSEYGLASSVEMHRKAGDAAADGSSGGHGGSASGSGSNIGLDGATIQITDTVSFDSGDASSMDYALSSLLHSAHGTRIVVLFAYSRDAAMVMARAASLGMTGKGWTWLGGEWVREATWTMPSTSSASASGSDAVLQSMQGVVGVVATPPSSSPGTPGAALARLRYADIVDNIAAGTASAAGVTGTMYPPPEVTQYKCPALFQWPLGTDGPGLHMDEFSSYVYEAVWAVASAAADEMAISGKGFPGLTAKAIGERVYETMAGSRPCPLTGQIPTWLANGDRYNMPISLVNVRGGSIVPVGTWISSVQPADAATEESTGTGLIANGMSHSDGHWQDLDPIIWASGTTVLPTDRSDHVEHAVSITLVVALLGLLVSLILGTQMHKYHFDLIPESGITVLVGALFGVIIRLCFDEDVKANASFNGEFFMLVLLPIIIFESGYALEKTPFFTQLFSISAYAIAGTVISTIVIGGLVFAAGSSGAAGGVVLSFEEAMSFASLLSATDPVATLAVFGALLVDPTLNALVYGESVINDAVSIVLYRTFTGFLVQEITTSAAMYAVLSFVAILFLSVFAGGIVGIITTLIFRLINLTGLLPKEGEISRITSRRQLRELLARAPAFKGAFQGRGNRRASVASPDPSAKIAKRHKSRTPATPATGDAPSTPSTIQVVTGVDEGAAAAGDSASVVGGDASSSELDVMAGIGETALLLLFAYVSFAGAEAMALSGIVSSLFCGIAMNMYTRPIMSLPGKRVSSAFFKMMATLADTAVFFQIGLNVVLIIGEGEFHMSFIAITLVGCLLGRALNVFPISGLLNLGRKDKIGWQFQVQMWHAGLRGAIAFASALTFPSPHRTTVVNATSWICLFTIFAMGSTTTPILKRLKIPYNVTSSSADRHHMAEEAKRESPVKRCLAWLDKVLQRIMYGDSTLKLLKQRKGDIQSCLTPAPANRGMVVSASGNSMTGFSPAASFSNGLEFIAGVDDTESLRVAMQFDASGWAEAEPIPAPPESITISTIGATSLGATAAAVSDTDAAADAAASADHDATAAADAVDTAAAADASADASAAAGAAETGAAGEPAQQLQPPGSGPEVAVAGDDFANDEWK